MRKSQLQSCQVKVVWLKFWWRCMYFQVGPSSTIYYGFLCHFFYLRVMHISCIFLDLDLRKTSFEWQEYNKVTFTTRQKLDFVQKFSLKAFSVPYFRESWEFVLFLNRLLWNNSLTGEVFYRIRCCCFWSLFFLLLLCRFQDIVAMARGSKKISSFVPHKELTWKKTFELKIGLKFAV